MITIVFYGDCIYTLHLIRRAESHAYDDNNEITSRQYTEQARK